MTSDVTVGEQAPPAVDADGTATPSCSPPRSTASYELWRIALADGRLERLTDGRHHISGWDARAGTRGRVRIAYLRSSPDRAAGRLVARRRRGAAPSHRRSTRDVLDELELRDAGRAARDGRRPRHPGLADPARDRARDRWSTEIHGGPADALRLVAGLGVPGPRGERHRASSTATRAAPRGTARHSTPATTATGGRDRPATSSPGVDALVADGLADPDRLGLTGGSYGGYLTSWIVGHDQRFRAAMTCRSVNDMSMIFTTGDIAGGALGAHRVRDDAVGRPGLLPRDLADHVRRTRSGRRC